MQSIKEGEHRDQHKQIRTLAAEHDDRRGLPDQPDTRSSRTCLRRRWVAGILHRPRSVGDLASGLVG